ncbi:MAG: DUF1657 domain-containing protein [Bacilli bacterium]
MTTIDKVGAAHASAQSLHATLTQFSLETVDPISKQMYQEMANAAQTIVEGIRKRQEQLADRETAIKQAQQPGT